MVRAYWAILTGVTGLTLGSAAGAVVLYDNGPCNCQSAAFSIAGGNYVTDSFTIGAGATVTGIDFAAWNYPTYSTTTSIDWAIYSGVRVPYGSPGPLIASGTSPVTSSFLLTNTSGYAVNTDTFAIPSTALASGIYSLVLANAVDTYGGGNIRWDVNYGPSTAIVHTNFGPFEGYQASETFQVLGSVSGAVPEPATWALFASGFGLTGGLMRRRWRGDLYGRQRVASSGELRGFRFV